MANYTIDVDTSFTTEYQTTTGNDVLTISSATITLLDPAGEIFLRQGDDTVTITDSMITNASQDGKDLAFYLGDGNDSLTVTRSTLDVLVYGFNGDDAVTIGGAPGTDVSTITQALLLEDGNDTLTVIGVLSGEGDIDFGDGSDTLVFDGGTLSTTGALLNLNNLTVTANGGELGHDLVLSGEYVLVAMSGDLNRDGEIRYVEIVGDEVEFSVDADVSTNVDYVLIDAALAKTGTGKLTFAAAECAITANGGSVTLDNADFIGVSKGGMKLDGAGLSGSELTFTGNYLASTFATAADAEVLAGGAIRQSEAEIELTDVTFDGNYVSAYHEDEIGAFPVVLGGAVAQSGGDMTVSSAFFTSNFVAGGRRWNGGIIARGGAIMHSDGDLFVENATFSGNYVSATAMNTASAQGGAIYKAGGSFELSDVSFVENLALAAGVGRGGALYISGADVELTDTVFTRNTAGQGGAIAAEGATITYTVSDGTSITDAGNAATIGGFIYLGSTDAVFDIGEGGILTLGSSGVAKDSIAGTEDSTITKSGAGTWTIHSDISDFAGSWVLASGLFSLESLDRTISLDSWTIDEDAELRFGVGASSAVAELNDDATVAGVISFYAADNVLDLKSNTLSGGTIQFDTLTIDGDGADVAILDSELSLFAAGTMDLTVGDATVNTDLVGGDNDDTVAVVGAAVFNGAIDLGAGNDTITVDAAAAFNAAIDLGDGDDALVVNTATTFDEAIDLGDGDDQVVVENASEFNGIIALGDGDNSITAENGMTLNDGISGGDGDDVVTLKTGETTIRGGVALGGGANWVYTSDTLNIASGGFIMDRSGLTTLVIYNGASVSDDRVSLYKDSLDEDLVTRSGDLSNITDSDKMRLVVSPEEDFSVIEFAVELYNHFDTFTVDIPEDYFVKLQIQDPNGWTWVDYPIGAPAVTVTPGDGVYTAAWDAVSAPFGVDFYQVQIAVDTTFDELFDEFFVTDTACSFALNPGDSYQVRVRAVDNAEVKGTWSDVVAIDPVADNNPVASADTAPTNQSVTVTAEFASSAVTEQYSFDLQTWEEYPADGVVMEENGNVYFRSIDADSNISGVTVWKVANIDKEAPTVTVTGDPTEWTNLDVELTAEFSDGESGIASQQYSYDQETWNDYASALTVEENKTVYFRAVDAAGNETVETFEVANIDKEGPTITVTGNPTEWTNLDVELESEFSDTESGLASQQYSYDQTTWYDCDSVLTITENTTVYFKAVDNVGNETLETVQVTKIDKVAPDAPVPVADTTDPTNQPVTVTATFSGDEGSLNEYSRNGVTWYAYTDDGVSVETNGTVYFRETDAAGNVSPVASCDVTNIDTLPPDAPYDLAADITEPTNGNVTVTAKFSDDSVRKQYSLDYKSWQEYTDDGAVMIDNGKVYFRGVDAAGNVSAVAVYTVTNIDKVPPAEPVASADITKPTNQSVTVTAKFSDDSATKEYSFDGAEWLTYPDYGVELSDNGTVYFRAADALGNFTAPVEYEVTNIDKIPPAEPVAVPSTTAPTNQPVTVAAEFSDDSVVREYSLDGSTWQKYRTGIVFEVNAPVYFRGIDAAGNISEIEYDVTNINTVPPDAPVASADITDPTNRNVTVTAKFSADTVVKEYSLDGGASWTAYASGVVMTDNGTVYFRATDAAGNVSECEYDVTNIDRVPPAKPEPSADITAPTNRDVTVTAVFSGDTVVKEYSLDGGESWIAYASGVVMTGNGTVIFRATDAAGNVSESQYDVTNISRVTPDKPTLTADITTLTNKDVTVSAAFDVAIATAEYSLDGVNWVECDFRAVMTGNGTVYFRGIDAAGNISEVAGYEVTNIDKVPPAKPTAVADITAETDKAVTVTASFSGDTVVKEYSLDSRAWKTYSSGVVMTKNGAVYFRGTDAAGNISDVTVYTVGNISCDDFTFSGSIGYDSIYRKSYAADLDSPGRYVLTGNFGIMDGKVTIYDGKRKVASGTVRAGALNFNNGKNFLLDSSNRYTIVVQNTDKGESASSFTMSLSATELFLKADVSDNDWHTAPTLSAGGKVDAWVGYGDAVDYRALRIDANGGFYSFDLSGATEKVKLTVYALKNGKLGKVKTVTASAQKPVVSLNELCLSASKTYYLAVSAPGAKTAKNSDYRLSMKENSVFNLANNDWKHAELLTDGVEFSGTITKTAGGDLLDCYNLANVGGFALDAVTGKAKVSFYDARGNALKVAEVKMADGSIKNNVASLTLTADNASTDHIALSDLDDAVRYLKVEAAAKGRNVYTIASIA